MDTTKDNIIKAYNIAKQTGADSTCKVLAALFPGVDFTLKDNRPVTERIKTFDDACNALGKEHPFVKQYEQWSNNSINNDEGKVEDIDAYIKLRIICAALNDGWEPQFTQDEIRWYPWHWLYTEDDIDNMSEEVEKGCGLMMTDDYVTDYCGFAFAHSHHAPAYAGTNFGSRLCFKSEALADYAGRQFISLWADFKLIRR